MIIIFQLETEKRAVFPTMQSSSAPPCKIEILKNSLSLTSGELVFLHMTKYAWKVRGCIRETVEHQEELHVPW